MANWGENLEHGSSWFVTFFTELRPTGLRTSLETSRDQELAFFAARKGRPDHLRIAGAMRPADYIEISCFATSSWHHPMGTCFSNLDATSDRARGSSGDKLDATRDHGRYTPSSY